MVISSEKVCEMWRKMLNFAPSKVIFKGIIRYNNDETIAQYMACIVALADGDLSERGSHGDALPSLQ